MKKQDTFLRDLALGSVLGLAGGIASSYWYRKKQRMSPDAILTQIKNTFLKEGPLEGSWISFETTPIQKFAVTIDSVSGGVTRMEDGMLVSYEFVADAKTGTVLSVERFENNKNLS